MKISDILIVGLACVIGLSAQSGWRMGSRTTALLAVYALASVFTTALSFSRRTELPTELLFPEMMAVTQLLILAAVAYAVGRKYDVSLRWFMVSMYIAAVMSLLALAQLLDFPGVRALLALVTGNDRILVPFDWQVYRASGLFPSWHALGSYLALHVAVGAALLHRSVLPDAQRRLLLGLVAACAIGTLTTITATPVVLAVGSLVFFAVRNKQQVLVFAIALAAGLVLLLSPLGSSVSERFNRQYGQSTGLLPQSFWFRVEVWQRDFLPIVYDNFWFGYGPLIGSFDLFSFTESMYIDLLIDGGFVLLSAFLIFYAALILQAFRLRRMRSAEGKIAEGLAFASIILFLGMFIHPYMRDVGGSFLLITAISILGGQASRSRSDEKPATRAVLTKSYVSRTR